MADDWEHPTRLQVPPKPMRPSSRRSSSVWQMNDARLSDSTGVNGAGRLRGPHRRYSSVANASEATTLADDPLKWNPGWAGEGDGTRSNSFGPPTKNGEDNTSPGSFGPRKPGRNRFTFPSTSPNPAPAPVDTHESESSSESSSTVVESTFAKQENPKKTRKSNPMRPDALSFLDSDSPQITDEAIKRSMHDASSLQSPSSTKGTSPTSSTSSSFQDDVSDRFADHETDRSTSPERSVDGDNMNHLSARLDPHGEDQNKQKQRKYGTPEMPRGNAQHPHISPDALTPRPPPMQNHAKHLPRAEKLPLTGYELLASRLSSPYSGSNSSSNSNDSSNSPSLRPMYRRFETLNHRLLLHLQDEICELEEQLHRLDTADTQNRRLRNAILPASRRAEYLAGGELQWHRTDILGKIGFKLEQYNHVLSSFRKTQSLPTPTLAEIHEYRGYLATHAPIAEAETRFLDATDDLVCVGEVDADEETVAEEDKDNEEAMATPMLRPEPDPPENIVTAPLSEPPESKGAENAPPPPPPPIILPLSLALAAAVIVPILTFTVIPGYLGRMIVVLLVGLGVLGGLIQGHVVGVGVNATRDFCVCIGVYGAVMAILAGIVA